MLDLKLTVTQIRKRLQVRHHPTPARRRSMEPANIIRSSWPGFPNIKYLIIFGDSYSDVGFTTRSPRPTLENPLGVEYPGYTWAGDGEPNWVGYLITEYNPGNSLLVHDYARGGDTLAGVDLQIRNRFLPGLGQKPEWAPWTAEDSLFVTWVGINDCAYGSDHARNLEKLFSLQDALYEAGARNFLFVDVPPIHRSPAVLEVNSSDHEATYRNWNSNLNKSVLGFSTSHPDASAMIFSSWDTFTRVLDDPVTHCYKKTDARKAGGAIWFDQLHPTSKMHGFIARDLAQFLNSQPAYSEAPQRS